MGFLHKLWDETLAGPAPESGLGKLRKYDSLSSTRTAPSVPADEAPVVTRSITILRTHSSNLGNFPADSGSPSESPTTPGTPVSRKTLNQHHKFEWNKNMFCHQTINRTSFMFLWYKITYILLFCRFWVPCFFLDSFYHYF